MRIPIWEAPNSATSVFDDTQFWEIPDEEGGENQNEGKKSKDSKESDTMQICTESNKTAPENDSDGEKEN